jgi:hypothetical protein
VVQESGIARPPAVSLIAASTPVTAPTTAIDPRGFVAEARRVHMLRHQDTPDRAASMTDAKDDPIPAHVAARQQRLRDALRENLKRRKSQSRGRADRQPAPGLADEVAAESADTCGPDLSRSGRKHV